ncbi:MAG: glucose-1-phosphate adenylyltransferase [Nitrospirae bacterium]|nr:glucose-1-phosphate adenylyltransferase [Nitrospirota bacterium]
MARQKVLGIILAGGRGNRLFPLTFERSKPAVPFGGRYRIIDFVLSNFINSRIFATYLLVQYKSQSLIEYVRENWVLSSIIQDHFVTVVPPQMRIGPEWFQGTADAVFQNLNLIRQHKPDLVAIFGADHIYRMDIRQMLDFHVQNKADVTVAARPIPISEGSSFGIIAADNDGRIRGFEEKPAKPAPIPNDSKHAYCSMGNYLFNTDVLIDALVDAQKNKQHDFGAYVIPSLVKTKQLFAYNFSNNIIKGIKPYEEKGYWRDVGTIKAYWEAHQDLLGEKPVFDLNNELWPIRPSYSKMPPAKILSGEIVNSMISSGALIKNATIINSLLRRGVTVEDGVEVRDSIIMDRVTLKKGCRLNKVIVDCCNVIEEGVHIGAGSKEHYMRAHLDPSGITVIASEMQSAKL